MTSRFSTRSFVIAVAAVAILAIGATTVVANHRFSDVPSSPASVHDAVDWVADRGITAGCGGGKYCPNNAVTRGQMAIFLQRTGEALSGELISQASSSAEDVNLDASTIVCPTFGSYTPEFPQLAVISGQASLDPALANLSMIVTTGYTANGGSFTDASPPNVPSGASDVGEDIFASHESFLFLNPGTTYTFGIRVTPNEGSSGDSTLEGDGTSIDPALECSLIVMAFNRNT